MWFVGTVPFGTMRRVGGKGMTGPVEEWRSRRRGLVGEEAVEAGRHIVMGGRGRTNSVGNEVHRRVRGSLGAHALGVSSKRTVDDTAKRRGDGIGGACESVCRAAAGSTSRRAARVLVGQDAGLPSGTRRAMKSPTSCTASSTHGKTDWCVSTAIRRRVREIPRVVRGGLRAPRRPGTPAG